MKEDVFPLAWPPSGSASKMNSSLQLAPLIWKKKKKIKKSHSGTITLKLVMLCF